MEKKLQKNISDILQLIGCAMLISSSLLNLVNNLSEGIHKNKYKCGHDDKKCETCGIIYKVCDCFVEYTNLKNNLIE